MCEMPDSFCLFGVDADGRIEPIPTFTAQSREQADRLVAEAIAKGETCQMIIDGNGKLCGQPTSGWMYDFDMDVDGDGLFRLCASHHAEAQAAGYIVSENNQ